MNCAALYGPDRLPSDDQHFWLSFFPRRYRFNFSGHNFIVLYENENGFRISDTGLLEHTVDCSAYDMKGRVSRAVPWKLAV